MLVEHNYKHLIEALRKKDDSISTANLLNFVGNGFKKQEDILLRKKLN